MTNQTDDQQPEEVVEENKEETPVAETQADESSEQPSAESEEVSPVAEETSTPAEVVEEPVAEETPAPAPAPASNGYTDKPLNCRECGADFTWTAGEQEFYAQKGFENPPVRCPNCRQLKKQRQSRDQGGHKQSYPITCSKCGKQDTVPFMPKGDQPLLCWDCFKGNR